MTERQNIEYKSSWHDDYLKWIGGFANAQGGRIYIGKDDTGRVVGLKDYASLMEEIPNKIKAFWGFLRRSIFCKKAKSISLKSLCSRIPSQSPCVAGIIIGAEA